MSSEGAGRRWLAGSLLVVAGSYAAAGCVSIPESSSIQQGREVGVQDEPQHVTNDPPGPQRGGSPQVIASGFFAAMLAYPQTVTTAQSFLTPRAAAHWDPASGVVVYDGQSVIPDTSGVSVSAHELGRLDERGAWTSVRPRLSQFVLKLRFARVNGEWRIVNPPAGLYIDNEYFHNDYGKFALYFFDPSFAVLAADPVYLVDDDTAATALVADLAQGPSASLRGAVVTAIPRETKIDVSVSASASGLAEVPLSEEVLQLSPDDRQLVAAQLSWTLRQLPEILRVSISVDGSDLEIPGFGSVFGVDEFTGYDPAGLTGERRLFALSPRGLVSVSPGGVSPVWTLGRDAAVPLSAAVDTKGTFAALVRGDGRSALVSGLPPQPDAGKGVWVTASGRLLRPSWDFQGVLWAVDSSATGSSIYVATADGQRRVPAPGLSGSDIVSFAVSRDGVRFAAVVRTGRNTSLVISTIERNPQHPERVRLGTPGRVLAVPPVTAGLQLRGLSQVAWVSPTAVVLLARGDEGTRQPWEVEIDGSNTVDVGQFLPVKAVSLAAGANIDVAIAVGTRSGQVYVQEPDLQWVRAGEGTRLRMPVYAG